MIPRELLIERLPAEGVSSSWTLKGGEDLDKHKGDYMSKNSGEKALFSGQIG